MTLVSVDQINPDDEVTAAGANAPHNQLATVINGSLDDANISGLSGTKITDGTITSAKLATAVNPETRYSEINFDFVASGCVWSGDSYGSTKAASMTSGVVYIAGKRVTVAAVTARTFTASKDTYIDVDNTGTLAYTEVTNNAASPALSSGYLRLGIIVTGASNIADAGSVNQGQENKVLPIASSIPYSVTDSLGNLICPRDPSRKVLGYRQAITDQGSITSEVDATSLTCPVIVPTGRKIKITGFALSTNATVDGYNQLALKEGSTTLTISMANSRSGTAYETLKPEYITSPSAGLHTYKVAVFANNGTMTLRAASTYPAFILVELA